MAFIPYLRSDLKTKIVNPFLHHLLKGSSYTGLIQLKCILTRGNLNTINNTGFDLVKIL